MPDDQPNVRDAKLIQYLIEAYGNEKRLETALQSHIEMAVRAPYKKRLRDHLTETKRHAREVERRVKELGGSAEGTPVPGPSDIAGVVISGVQKATALAQGPLHALRGTGAEERQLKNAKTEFAEEAQEIGIYSAIQTFAEKVGDRDTASLARAILRDEQRMATFLEKEIAHLANAVATAEVPARLRNGAATRRRRAAPSTRRRAGATASRSSAGTRSRAASRSTGRSTSRSTSRSGASARSGNGAQRAASSASGTRRKRSTSAAATRRTSAPAAAR
jgi:ferritin-like metal-binding protein YciE